MPEIFHFRKATNADIREITRLRRQMREEVAAARGWSFVSEEMAVMEEAYIPFARAHLKDGTMKAWVIEAQGQIVACGALLILHYPPYPGEPKGRVARLSSMYTLPEYRRKGLARRIALKAIDYCKAQGIKRLALGASTAGKPLYESLGFRPTSEMRLELS